MDRMRQKGLISKTANLFLRLFTKIEKSSNYISRNNKKEKIKIYVQWHMTSSIWWGYVFGLLREGNTVKLFKISEVLYE